MKKLLFALLLCAGAASSAFGQSGNVPITITEVDGSPRITNPSKITVSNGSLTVSGRNAIIVTGGGGGGGSPGGSNTQVQYNAAGSFGGAAGFTFNGTAKITLGVAGSSVGAIGFNNATSGQITLQPVTGALGTVTLSLPAATDTLVGRATTDTFTFKTYDTAGTGNSFLINGLAVTANTGTGAVARASSPTFVTPTLGAATATSINGLTITTSTGTLTITNGKTASVSNTLTFTGTDGSSVAFGAGGTVAYVGLANSWTAGIKQTFAPNGTTAGINVGSVAGDPSTPANGDLWYDSTANELTARINGANVALGSGGGGGITVGTTTITSGTNTRIPYNNAGVYGEISGFTSDGTNVTAGSGNLRATLPQITTGIRDANGNLMLGFSPTASATESITIANNTATNAVSLTATTSTAAASTQAGNGFNVTAAPAVAGTTNAGAAVGGSVTITAGNAARLTSGNANGGNVVLVPGAAIGTGTKGIVAIGGVTSSDVGLLTFTNSFSVPGLGIIRGNSTPDNQSIHTGAIGVTQVATSDGSNSIALVAASGTVTVGSGGSFEFSSSTNGTLSAMNGGDTGLARSAAAVVRVSNGSTGAGTFSSVAVTPAQITADQNNYAPGVGWFQRWSSDASRNVTGLSAGQDGQVIEVYNVGSNNIVLVNESASSTAANRFANSTGADLTLTAGKCAEGRYDSTSARWRMRLCN